jgi:aquaporin related protein
MFHLDVDTITMTSISNFPPRSGKARSTSQTYQDSNSNNIRNQTGDTSGIRARKQDNNLRRAYGNAVGNLGGRDDDSTGTETTRNGISRRHIRKRLKEKEKIPGHVQWIKWMNSEWKNRKSSSI